jgi:hypothetical protein
MGADAVFVESRSKRSMGHVMSTLVDCGISVKTRIPHEVPPAGSHVTVEFASTDEPWVMKQKIDQYSRDAECWAARSIYVN